MSYCLAVTQEPCRTSSTSGQIIAGLGRPLVNVKSPACKVASLLRMFSRTEVSLDDQAWSQRSRPLWSECILSFCCAIVICGLWDMLYKVDLAYLSKAGYLYTSKAETRQVWGLGNGVSTSDVLGSCRVVEPVPWLIGPLELAQASLPTPGSALKTYISTVC